VTTWIEHKFGNLRGYPFCSQRISILKAASHGDVAVV
jgi:hypothetical protein